MPVDTATIVPDRACPPVADGGTLARVVIYQLLALAFYLAFPALGLVLWLRDAHRCRVRTHVEPEWLLPGAGKELGLEPRTAGSWAGRVDGRSVTLSRIFVWTRGSRRNAQRVHYEVKVQAVEGSPRQEFHLGAQSALHTIFQRLDLASDVQVGDPRIDDRFLVTAASPGALRRLLDPRVLDALDRLDREIEIAFDAGSGLVFRYVGAVGDLEAVRQNLVLAARLLVDLARRIEETRPEDHEPGPPPGVETALARLGHRGRGPIRMRSSAPYARFPAFATFGILYACAMAISLKMPDVVFRQLAAFTATLLLLVVLVPVSKSFFRSVQIARWGLVLPVDPFGLRVVAWRRIRSVDVGVSSERIRRGSRVAGDKMLDEERSAAPPERSLVVRTDRDVLEVPQSDLSAPVGRVRLVIQHFLDHPEDRARLEGR